MNSSHSLRIYFGLTGAALAAAAFVTLAPAGEYSEKEGVALRGCDAVAYLKDSQAVDGVAEHRTVVDGLPHDLFDDSDAVVAQLAIQGAESWVADRSSI